MSARAAMIRLAARALPEGTVLGLAAVLAALAEVAEFGERWDSRHIAATPARGREAAADATLLTEFPRLPEVVADLETILDGPAVAGLLVTIAAEGSASA